MKYIYLDNSATTELSDAVKSAMISAMDKYGNPSSIHACGLESGAIITESRKMVAMTFGVRDPKPGELIFTSSGTEANNLAIKGVAFAKKRRPAEKILITDSEHPSVENVAKDLEAHGFKVSRISTRNGVLDFEQLERELQEPVLLASFMMVNNETGAIYDVKKAFAMVKRFWPDAVTHCDAVQGYMKEVFTPASIFADLVSVSGHKIHGPKGIGALYVSPLIIKTKKLVPVTHGGGQEYGFRSGTENIINIAGFAVAANEQYSDLRERINNITRLREIAELALSGVPEIRINIPAGRRAPHIINLTLPKIKSETMLHFLSSKGICISSGSACSSKAAHHSPSLLAFGLTPSEADTSVRISLSEYNTEEDVSALACALSEGIERLVRIK